MTALALILTLSGFTYSQHDGFGIYIPNFGGYHFELNTTGETQ
jgi:hypothetical protein